MNKKAIVIQWVFLLMLGLAVNGRADSTAAIFDSTALKTNTTLSLNQAQVDAPSLTGHYLKLLAATFILLAVLYFALKGMRKLQFGSNGASKGKVKVLSKTYLTSKHSVWIVNIDGQKYLLGVTDQNINLIDRLGPVTEEEAGQTNDAVLPKFGNFFEKIRKGG
ncbi:MAG: flagellar biosynthetic protein FliO [Calditrichaeota bacterium]|nr:flagellar biosynthetic protein FliO [Calditrichota bacterium]